MKTKIKKFKTIHILEVISDIVLIDKGNFQGFVEVVLFLCGVKTPAVQISREHFITIYDCNKKVVMLSLLEQHPPLKKVMQEANEMKKRIAAPHEWERWRDQKIKDLGTELDIFPAGKILKVEKPIVIIKI